MTGLRRVSIAVAVATIGVVVFVLSLSPSEAAGPGADDIGQHGATKMELQQTRLDGLLAGEHEARIDPEVWKASIPKDNQQTPERIALGRELYFDTALSKDGTVSCATCHDVTRSFTDRRAVSEGVDGKLGKRNAPTNMNAALLQTQFLDGRAATLEEQAGGPFLNPVEMAMPDEKAVITVLESKPQYKQMFQKAYGREPNYKDLERALAAFQRTLIFLDAPFDRFLAGDETAVSQEARAGWELFNGRGRCITCHHLTVSNPLGTDNRMHNIGVSARKQDFEKMAKQALEALGDDPTAEKLDELAIGTDLSELGRFMVTRNYADIGAFRTPQIRNAGITAPYMHDGSLDTLWDVMDHYNKGGETNPYLDGGMEALDLTEEEIDQLVALLFTLTDDRFAELNEAEMKRQHELSRKQRPIRDEAQASRKVLHYEERVLKSPAGGGGKP